MDIKAAVERLEHSTEFSRWKKQHPNSFFADAFMIFDDEGKTHWQLGYYDAASKKITVFVMEDVILVKQPGDVFKKENDAVLKVDLDKVALDSGEALKKVREVCILEYPAEKVVKTIFILQHIKEGLVWNITNITESLKTINVKIDAGTGKVVGHKLVSLFEFRKK